MGAHVLAAFGEGRVVAGVVPDGMAGAEALPVGLDDQDLDVVVPVGVEDGRVDLLGQLLVLGVRLLGLVQDDVGYRPVLLVDDAFAGLLEVHARRLVIP